MNWTELLKSEIEPAYRTTAGLMDLVEDEKLNWKPATGSNWMTTGQLLKHLTEGCGVTFKGFVTKDWGMPTEEIAPEAMLPTAERLPTVSSVAEAKRLLAEDKQAALDILAQCTEDRLDSEPTPAPWDPSPLVLGYRLLGMIAHVNQHKSQLFYYLKLQGKPVNTSHLWG
jgi:hypothetical protein